MAKSTSTSASNTTLTVVASTTVASTIEQELANYVLIANNSDNTSTQSISLNDGSNDSISNIDVKNVSLRNQLKQKFDKRLSCNDTSSTTTTTTNEEEFDVEQENIEENEDSKKSVEKLREAFQKNVKPGFNKINSTTALISKPTVPHLRKRSMPNLNPMQLSSIPTPKVLFSDSVMVSKLNLNKVTDGDDDHDDEASLKHVHETKVWERKWISLTDERILTIYSCHNDLKTNQVPNNLINLNMFELGDVGNETSFELLKRRSLAIDTVGDCGESLAGNRKTKSFINLFEYTNYEFKFLNHENKNKLFNLINDL